MRKATIRKRLVVKQGDFYADGRDIYLVARTGVEQFRLVALDGGNRWSDSDVSLSDIKEEVRKQGFKKIDVIIEEN